MILLEPVHTKVMSFPLHCHKKFSPETKYIFSVKHLKFLIKNFVGAFYGKGITTYFRFLCLDLLQTTFI